MALTIVRLKVIAHVGGTTVLNAASDDVSKVRHPVVSSQVRDGSVSQRSRDEVVLVTCISESGLLGDVLHRALDHLRAPGTVLGSRSVALLIIGLEVNDRLDDSGGSP